MIMFSPYSWTISICCMYICSVAQVCLTLCDPLYWSQLGFSVHRISRQEYCVGCHFLLPGIFLIQGSNLPLLTLPHWEAGLHHWAPGGALSIHVAAVSPPCNRKSLCSVEAHALPCESVDYGNCSAHCGSSISSPFCWLPRPFDRLVISQSFWAHSLQSSGGPCAQLCPRLLGSLDACSLFLGSLALSGLPSLQCSVETALRQ